MKKLNFYKNILFDRFYTTDILYQLHIKKNFKSLINSVKVTCIHDFIFNMKTSQINFSKSKLSH